VKQTKGSHKKVLEVLRMGEQVSSDFCDEHGVIPNVKAVYDTCSGVGLMLLLSGTCRWLHQHPIDGTNPGNLNVYGYRVISGLVAFRLISKADETAFNEWQTRTKRQRDRSDGIRHLREQTARLGYMLVKRKKDRD
jgi:hypothetical protein